MRTHPAWSFVESITSRMTFVPSGPFPCGLASLFIFVFLTAQQPASKRKSLGIQALILLAFLCVILAYDLLATSVLWSISESLYTYIPRTANIILCVPHSFGKCSCWESNTGLDGRRAVLGSIHGHFVVHPIDCSTSTKLSKLLPGSVTYTFSCTNMLSESSQINQL